MSILSKWNQLPVNRDIVNKVRAAAMEMNAPLFREAFQGVSKAFVLPTNHLRVRAVPQELRMHDPATPFWPQEGTKNVKILDWVEVQFTYSEKYLPLWLPATVASVIEDDLFVFFWINGQFGSISPPKDGTMQPHPRFSGWRKMNAEDKSFWNSLFDFSVYSTFCFP